MLPSLREMQALIGTWWGSSKHLLGDHQFFAELNQMVFSSSLFDKCFHAAPNDQKRHAKQYR